MPKVPRDIVVLFSSRIVRMFAYGWLSVTLALFLTRRGIRPTRNRLAAVPYVGG